MILAVFFPLFVFKSFFLLGILVTCIPNYSLFSVYLTVELNYLALLYNY